MDAVFHLRATDFVSEIAGISLAVLLLFLCFLLLRPSERRRAHQAVILLVLSLGAGFTRALSPQDAGFRRPLLFAAVFFLLASISRSLVLLVLDVVVGRRAERPTPRIFRDL